MNQYNSSNHSSNRAKKSQFVIANGPCDKPKSGSVLNGRFNILLTAKREFQSKNENIKIRIIPMIPAFASSPTWIETTTDSYSAIFEKENSVPINIPMQQPIFFSQGFPQHAQPPQAYVDYQYVYQAPPPQYGMFIPNMRYQMMGENPQKMYQNPNRHGHNY